ncbi:VWA domain-containing protein [Campylobacter sp. FMV-PI01]|uniref:VWA domain-containing protein n=1 Tax=Campylobacter portucalensis TaxID=2608384 RepID=A0A6L5WKZ9_9BACT|nr:VWA domain-containing protein [Campylobacter portucalensis]MSN96947.1 VWA domain-containing protein [Campylobacter portucalensis]
MIEFENLWVLWLLIIAFFLLFFISKTKISNFRPEILDKIYVKSRGFSKRIRKILLILSFIFCIIALARPILNNGEIKVRKDFINLAIGIDISNSMIVDDVFPNRFEFAKNKIFSFLKNANDKEISLLGFSDRAFLISPLTNDFNSLSFLLKNLNFSHLKLKGTSVMSLLESVKSLSNDGGALVIFTDGGDNENFEKEIEFANKNNIKVFVYLVATDKGGLLKSENGKMVLLKANRKIGDLALNTGGDIMQYSFENSDMGKLNKIISSKFSAKSEEDEIIKDKKELFYYPLILAIILFFMANFSLPQRRKA